MRQPEEINILLSCEESQACCEAFRRLGFNAFSNDILPASGLLPQYHIQGDAIDVMYSKKWDAIISFPPCTDLAVSGARWFEEKRRNGSQQQSIDFFMEFVKHPCKNKSIENPIGIMSSLYRKPDQIIQPWMFGHGEVKATCLWLFGFPKLIPTNIVSGREQRIWKLPPTEDRAKLRSRTYHGIAQAMAHQWSQYLIEQI